MIKYWQSMHDYKYFLTESKVHFDSSERNQLHTELWEPWQKLRLFDTDKAMEFLHHVSCFGILTSLFVIEFPRPLY